MSQTSIRSSNFFSTKNSQRQLDINILQIFIKDHPTRRDALAINDNRALRLFGRSADTSAVRINGNLRPSGNFSTKRRTRLTRRTPPSIFSRFQRDFRGALFSLAERQFFGRFFVCESAFGSFAKVSESRRVRAFANVPNRGWTKNMTKNYVWKAFHNLAFITETNISACACWRIGERRQNTCQRWCISQHRISIPKELAAL